MRIGELLQYGITALSDAGVPDGVTDIYLLLGHVLNKSRTGLMVAEGEDVSEEKEKIFRQLLARRVQREPLAYILGEQEFWSLPFTVTDDVLIPRPETEFLLEQVLLKAGNHVARKGHVVDLCCGSGVIAIVLALELKCRVTGIDISPGALAVSRKNCFRHGVSEQVSLVRSDLLSCISDSAGISLFVSNPPYVSSGAIQNELEPEVAGYEPHLALDGGEWGMDCIAIIRNDLPSLLIPGGHVFMEIGWDQGEMVRDLFSKTARGQRAFTTVEILKDYAGRDRVLHAIIE